MNYWQQGVLNFQHKALLFPLFVIKSTVTCSHSLLCFIRKLGLHLPGKQLVVP